MKLIRKRQDSFASNFAEPASQTYGNAEQSAIKAGYSSKWANRQAHLLLDNSRLKTAISAKIAKRQAKIEYNYEKAIAELDKIITNLTKQADTGHIQANSALIQAVREKNAITGLHKQTIKTEPIQPKADPAETETLRDIARTYKLRIAKDLSA